MKAKYLFTAIAFFITAQVCGQQFDLNQFNKERLKINKTGMTVLGAWAVGNMAWGGIGWAASKTDGSHKYFHQMNFLWGTVNGALAGLSLISGKKLDRTYSFSETVSAQRSMEKLFLINAGLDVAYIGAGVWMLEKSKTPTSKPERWEGYGNSLLIQGGFLLLFDGIMYTLHNKHGKILFKQLDNVQLAAGPSHISLVVKL